MPSLSHFHTVREMKGVHPAHISVRISRRVAAEDQRLVQKQSSRPAENRKELAASCQAASW